MATGGGGLLVRDTGNGAIEQLVTPASIPAGASLIVESYLGGGLNDWTRLIVRVLDASNTQISQHSTGYVTEQQRNREAVHLYRKLVVPVPAIAAKFAIRVEFANQCCGAAAASADRITAHLVTGSTLPPPVSIGVDLLDNGGFESGWTAGSPLALNGGGWEGAGADNSVVVPYSNSSSSTPSGIVSCLINGAAPNNSCVGGAAGNMLQHNGGNSAVVQTVDVRGSTSQFSAGALGLHYAAYLGGIGAEGDTAQLEVRFRSLSGSILQSGLLGPVSAAARNRESVVVRRENSIVVPPNTAFIDFVASFANACCGASFGVVDNISASLQPTTSIAAIPLNANLVPNESFESGSLPGSPLELNSPAGWFGVGASRSFVPQYGTPPMPTTAFASANGLGALLLQDGGTAHMRCDIDLRGSTPLIGSGSMVMQASAWIGGVTNNNDTAEVRVRFETIAGVPTGLVQTLAAVTAAERQGVTTLIKRTTAPFAVPQSAAKAIVEIVFTNACCGGSYGLVDDIRLVAFDATQQPGAVPFPGTSSSDLSLATGVDELPRTGFGETIKHAVAGQVLRTRVGSPSGSLDGSPVLLALSAFPTGQAPTQFFPDIWINPNHVLFLYNGWFGTSFAPVVVPLAQGGNVYSQVVPAGLGGVSLLLQSVALPTPGAPSPNGAYFATEAHEIRVQ